MAPVSIVQVVLTAILVLSGLGLAILQWQESQALKELGQQLKGIDRGDHEQFLGFMNIRMRIQASSFDKQKPLQTVMLVCMAILLASIILER